MRQIIPLTKRNADSARAGQYLWDAKLRGFGLFVHQSGTKSFILKKRTVNNRQIKLTIGRFGELTIDQARNIAQERTTELIKGNDPSQSKRNAREIPRFDHFARRYLTEHCEVKKQADHATQQQVSDRESSDSTLRCNGHQSVRPRRGREAA